MQTDMRVNEQSTLKEIDRLFKIHGRSNALTVQFKCSVCGVDAGLELHKTAKGYGMNGGVFFIASDDQRLTKCLSCHIKATETAAGYI